MNPFTTVASKVVQRAPVESNVEIIKELESMLEATSENGRRMAKSTDLNIKREKILKIMEL